MQARLQPACGGRSYALETVHPTQLRRTGYRYVFDGHVFAKAPTTGTQEENGQQYTVNYTPVCTGNLAGGQVAGDTLCVGAAAMCPPGEVRLWQVLTPCRKETRYPRLKSASGQTMWFRLPT